MPPKAPDFWQADGWKAKLLSPLSRIFYWIHKFKSSACCGYKSSVPVFCVGGVVVGGSGKTPTLHAFLDLIGAHLLYQKPVVLLRGYGGRIKKATIVDPAVHTYKDVGDEALLHAARSITIVSASRASGAKMAESIGADIILMDDGLQNSSLKKSASVLVIDTSQGLGNERLLPAGPLREPIKEAMDKVRAVVQIGSKNFAVSGKPVLKARIVPSSKPDVEKTYIGFAGIGNPEKFRQMIGTMGLNMPDFISFPDHHPYEDDDMKKLKTFAGEMTLVTTAKDFVRIPAAYRDGIEVIDIQLVFDDPIAATALLKDLS